MKGSGTVVPINMSLWASKTRNSTRTESVTCDPGRNEVSGQPLHGGSVYTTPSSDRNQGSEVTEYHQERCPERSSGAGRQCGIQTCHSAGFEPHSAAVDLHHACHRVNKLVAPCRRSGRPPFGICRAFEYDSN